MTTLDRNMWIAFAIWVAFLLLMAFASAQARDLGQWENSDPEVREWYKSLMRPEPAFSYISCCGDADAYWCDDIHVKDGHTFCAITDTRDDGPLKRPHRPVGEVHEIPPEKMKFGPNDPQRDKASNPTGHSIIFLSSAPGEDAYVYCFVGGMGS